MEVILILDFMKELRQAKKRWINEDEDLRQMYIKYKSGEVHLWCDVYANVATCEPPQKRG